MSFKLPSGLRQSTAVLWGGLLFLWGLAWKLRALW